MRYWHAEKQKDGQNETIAISPPRKIPIVALTFSGDCHSQMASEPPVVLHRDLRFDKPIGMGGFAGVWRGRYLPTDQEVAIKKLHTNEWNADSRHEIRIQAMMHHKYVIGLIGYTEVAPLCIVSEFVPNGSLFNALHSKDSPIKLTPTDLSIIAMAVAVGMDYIHSLHVIHRDLKSMNILLDKRNQPKIADFGISLFYEQVGKLAKKSFGTASCMAPEEHRNEVISPAVDVYSYGVMLWEMLTHGIPFEGRDPVQIIYAVAMKGERPVIPEGTPSALETLIERCWAQDPTDRPTFAEIVEIWMDGDVMFPGTVRSSFRNYFASYGGRRSMRRVVDPICLTPRVAVQQMINSPDIPVSEIVDILTKANDAERIKDVVKTIEGSEKVRQQLGDRLWALLLPLTVAKRSTNYQERVIKLLERICVSQRNLESLQSTPNLHEYLCPATMNIFLYIISFVPSVITPKIVTELERGVLSPGWTKLDKEHAVILLCKVLENLNDRTMRSFITKFMLRNAESAVDYRYGNLMLKALARYAKDPCKAAEKILPIAVKYLKSSIELNIAAGYQVVMYLAPESIYVGLDDCLNHVLSKEETLRELALEYLRRHFIETQDITMAQRIVHAALTTYEQNHSERAAMLMFHFASIPGLQQIFRNPAFQTQYLNLPADKAPDVVQLLIFIMRIDPGFLMHPAIPKYLSAILKYGDNQEFVMICLLIDRDGATREFLLSLEENGFLVMMCDRVSRCTSLVVSNYAAKALLRFAQVQYFEAYKAVIPAFATLLDTGIEAAPIVVALSMLSQYPQLLPDLTANKVRERLSPFFNLGYTAKFADYLAHRLQ